MINAHNYDILVALRTGVETRRGIKLSTADCLSLLTLLDDLEQRCGDEKIRQLAGPVLEPEPMKVP